MRWKGIRFIGEVLIIAALGLVLAQNINVTLAPPSELKEHFYARGVQETGAINLVSSIYLSYRAFDTLGEIIVLLLAVSGVISILGAPR